ncbi:hypothetical protein I4200191B4_15070 [Pseudoflavonifractor gallinarum]
MAGEEIFDQLMPAKAARLIKGDGGGAVPGVHLQHCILSPVDFRQKLHQGLAVAFVARSFFME